MNFCLTKDFLRSGFAAGADKKEPTEDSGPNARDNPEPLAVAVYCHQVKVCGDLLAPGVSFRSGSVSNLM